MSSVLDASALLAVLNGEPGMQRVTDALLDDAVILSVNLAEVVTKLVENGLDELAMRSALAAVNPVVVPFDEELAYRAGLLRPVARSAGLSLGDRACLALAERLNIPALTTDRAWERVQVGIQIDVIR